VACREGCRIVVQVKAEALGLVYTFELERSRFDLVLGIVEDLGVRERIR